MLPHDYPLEGMSITDILDQENFAGRLVDYGVLLPRVQALYEYAAADLGEPRLLEFVANGNPVYAWPYEARAAWQPRRYRRLIALAGRLTPHR